MRKLIFIFLLVFVAFLGKAQDQVGSKLSNSVPTQMARLNPSAIVDQKPYKDFELFGASLYGDNNFARLSKHKFSLFQWKWPDAELVNKNEEVRSFGEATIFLPSFSKSLGKYSVGFRSEIRTYQWSENISHNLAQLGQEAFNFSSLENIPLEANGFRVSMASWLDLGVQVGAILHQHDKNQLSGGLSLRRLVGIGAAGIEVNDMAYVANDRNLSISSFNGELGITSPNLNSGSGWGLDLGVTYQRKLTSTRGYTPHSRRSGCRYIDYKWKIGLALLDVGSIIFKTQSYSRTIENASLPATNISELEFENVEQIVNWVDSAFVDGAVRKEQSYSVALPTALNLQFDYNLENDFRIGLVGNLSLNNTGDFKLKRLHYIAVIPRYEREQIEFGVPVSTNSFLRPRVGFMLRVGPFTLGSDNFLPLFSLVDVHELQAYCSLRILRLYSNECASKKKMWRVKDCTAPSLQRKKHLKRLELARNRAVARKYANDRKRAQFFRN